VIQIKYQCPRYLSRNLCSSDFAWGVIMTLISRMDANSQNRISAWDDKVKGMLPLDYSQARIFK
jgi:hypothetical protein